MREQCRAAEVAFFFKQVGGRTPKAGGRYLDGEIWDEMPEAWEIHRQKWGNSSVKSRQKLNSPRLFQVAQGPQQMSGRVLRFN
ncbi:MAG: DUF5131 family protein [Oscillatoria sp. SIO1A7]|nr:DUF5131 family protein [Oscillatoria sp. SIO1A7]